MALTTAYDPIFARHAGRIPVAYLRSLASRESSFRPTLAMSDTSSNAARGLLQVVGVVRADYNRKHGTSYTADDLFDPDTNVKIASDALNRIIDGYQKHPSSNMKADWRNPEFVKLLTAGWNSGYSEAGGVGRVASYLEQRGRPVTHDAVFAAAGEAGATANLQTAARRSWQRSVADVYYAQPDAFEIATGVGAWILGGFVIWGSYQLLK